MNRWSRFPRCLPAAKSVDIWLHEKISDLVHLGSGLETPPNNAFRARSWTLLKLACVRYYIPAYLGILRSRYDRLSFVDLFSSAGVSRYSEGGSDFVVPGSSVIAAAGAERPNGEHIGFDEIVAVDRSRENLDVLERNLRRWNFRSGTNLVTIPGDSPSEMASIGRHLSKTPKTHALVFADPDSLALPFDAIRSLVKSHDGSDLVLLHLISGAAMSNSPDVLRRMYGCDPPRSERELLSQLYADQLTSRLRGPRRKTPDLPRTVVERVRVTAGGDTGGYSYDVVFAWRKTSGLSPFSRIVESLRSKIEHVDGKDAERVLSTLAGGQSRLDDYDSERTGPTGN
jgi:three-Cys-motif partner protein